MDTSFKHVTRKLWEKSNKIAIIIDITDLSYVT